MPKGSMASRGDSHVYIEGRRFLTRRLAWPASFSQELCADWRTALGDSERLIDPWFVAASDSKLSAEI